MSQIIGLLFMAFSTVVAHAQETRISNVEYRERALVITVESDKDLVECSFYKNGVQVVTASGSTAARIANVTLPVPPKAGGFMPKASVFILKCF